MVKAVTVYEYIMERLREEGALHFTLIDPDPSKINADIAEDMAKSAEDSGSAAIMIGGSIGVCEKFLDDIIDAIKRVVKIPVILFPGNISGISRKADAIFFMSLLNSEDLYFVIGAQVLGAPIVKMYGLEAIPMGYIIIEPGEAAGFIGRARPIPINHPEIASAFALAAQYLGMKFVYLERGSGAREAIPAEFVRRVTKVVDIPVIVGGGIRDGKTAKELVKAGASIIVTGTVVEESKDKLKEIVNGIKEGGLFKRGVRW